MRIPTISTTVSKSTMVLCLGICLHTVSASADANQTRLSTIGHSFLSGCSNAIETGAKQSTACLIDSALPVALDLAEQSGTGVFGERFSITDNLSYDDLDGLRGEIDLLFPLGAARSQALFRRRRGLHCGAGQRIVHAAGRDHLAG